MTEEVLVFPLSSAQQRLWLMDQFNPGSSAYNLPTTLVFETGLDISSLARAFNELLKRHEILRTQFSTVDGQPVQVISPTAQINLPIVDLSGLLPAHWDEAARRLVQEEGQRPFDLSRGPLLRITLLKLTSQSYVMLLTMHHIITDGWSMTILHREIHALYSAYCKGEPSPLAELAIQYADFAVWQREQLSSPELKTELDYWRKQLAGITTLELPTDRPRPPIQTHRGSSVVFHCSQQITDGLTELSQSAGVTPYMTLLATFQLLLSRYSGQTDIAVGTAIAGRNRIETESLIGFFVNTLVMRTNVFPTLSICDLLERVKEACLNAYAHQDLPFEKLVEELQPERDLSRTPLFQVMFVLQSVPQEPSRTGGEKSSLFDSHPQTARFDLVLSVTASQNSLACSLLYNTDLFDRRRIERMAEHFQNLLAAIVAEPEKTIGSLPMMSDAERQQILTEWNDTARDYPRDICIHHLFEAQVDRTPEAIALCYEDQQFTYRQLNKRANQLAHYLRGLGVQAEVLVGLCVERSVDMLLGLLGILKAGGAYVPLDPEYPLERLSFMLQNAAVTVLLTQQRLMGRLPPHRGQTVALDSDWSSIAACGTENPSSLTQPGNTAYVIYTSGSAGTPKGVMVEHRNVVNFFSAMDPHFLTAGSPGVWLAVTSISFDISVLELLWTLARGFKVVLPSEPDRTLQNEGTQEGANVKHRDDLTPQARSATTAARGPALTHIPPMSEDTRPSAPAQLSSAPQFSLFYFAHDGTSAVAHNRYKVLLEGARFADQHGFTAVWTPERHFHPFGDLYPNPAVAGAALATITSQVQIRAGSVVLPLHHVVRVAEEGAMVDNLSNGRVGISFASGWHAADFIFAPDHYRRRKEVMIEQLDQVRRLWRGESLAFRGGGGDEVSVRIYPPPVQPELPVWLTAAGSPETFEIAGQLGCGILTHLLGQKVEELRAKILKYREAWAQAGHQGRGQVALMLHTYIGDDEEQVKRLVKRPFKNYLAGSVDLMKSMAKSLGVKVDGAVVNAGDMEAVLEHAFERYYEESGLMGAVEKCAQKIKDVSDAGVDEIACLIDFGVEEHAVLKGLANLAMLKNRSTKEWQQRWSGDEEDANALKSNGPAGYGIRDGIETHGVTHMQCTPSLAGVLSLDTDTFKVMGSVNELLLGGEVLPPSLLNRLGQVATARVHNMYGPTETTIWSAMHTFKLEEKSAPIGRAIANTQIYILSDELQPTPIGVAGELYIGGAGVTRGYLHNADLTAERFVPHPFSPIPGARFYRTGDKGRFLPGGSIEFLGRTDYQVKIKGHRIELGEIETALNGHPTVQESVVLASEGPTGEQRLVAYVVCGSQVASGEELQSYIRGKLPEYMVPAWVLILDQWPLTPNRKIDRGALPAPAPTGPEVRPAFAEPSTPTEELLVGLWCTSLKLERVSVHDNFFELGGHSLLAMQLISRVREALNIDLPLRHLFEAPTVARLAERIEMALLGQPNLDS